MSLHPTLAGQTILTAFQAIPDPFVTEVMAKAGYDAVIVDLQHGLGTVDGLTNIVLAAESAGIGVLVRVPANTPEDIGRALDRGAHGVIVPLVNTAEEAQAAVDATRYPPRGKRSFGSPRLALSGISSASSQGAYTPPSGGFTPFLAVMAETRQSVEALEEIARVPGIDAIFVGPADLGLDIGVTSPVMMPELGSEHDVLIHRACQVARDRGLIAGIACASANEIERWISAGFNWFAVGGDFGFLLESAMATATATRSKIGSVR